MEIPKMNVETMKNSVSMVTGHSEIQVHCLPNTSLEHYCHLSMLVLYYVFAVVLAPVPAWMGCVLLSIMLVLYWRLISVKY
jgi:hypothetical protein